MFNGEQQKKEIETIRERNITVKLSDADCERLVRKCGEHGLTVGELIANFVGDLVGGTYSNGSDERMFADQWFDRCWFGMFPEDTLLRDLLFRGYNPEDYLNALDILESAVEDKKKAAEHPEDYDEEEISYIDDDIETWEEKLKDMRADWKPEKEPNMDEELEIIKKWVKERRNLMDGKPDTERLSKGLYSHLCQYRPLKELLMSVHISGEVFTKEIKFALEELLNE